MNERIRRLGSGLIIGVLVGGVFAVMQARGILAQWEARTYDWRLQTVAQFNPQNSQVVMGYVDQPSLDFMQKQGVGWPWPREMYSHVLRFCQTGGARAVVFDIIYSEDSIYGAADDAAFAAALAEFPRSYMAVFLSRKSVAQPQDSAPILAKSEVQLATPPPFPLEEALSFAAMPLPAFMQAAHGFGNVQLAPDRDGIYRRVALLSRYQDHDLPSLYIGLLHGESPTTPLQFDRQGALQFGSHRIPLDSQGRMVLKYYGGVDTFPHYSLAQLILSGRALQDQQPPEIDPAVVKDKVVIIGVAAPGLYDLRPQPLASRYPGAEIHATVFQNILTNDYMRVLPLWQTLLYIVVLAVVVAVVLRGDWQLVALVVILLVAVAAVVGSGWWGVRMGVWLPLVAPLFAMLVVFAVTLAVNFLAEGRKKREIRATFQKYLAPSVVKELLKNPDAIMLGGAEQDITVLFSDLADFTSFSEGMTPSELLALLNEYLTTCSGIIMREGGTIDKYIGDAIMSFWGAPLPMTDHALRACRAALRIQTALAPWNAERQTKNLPLLLPRTGIHSGRAVVGNMGSAQRMNYTAMGDTVNLASRLEGLNKFFGSQILISGSTYAHVQGEFLCRHLGAVRVKGRNAAIELYDVRAELATATAVQQQEVVQFEAALAHYKVGALADAKLGFEAVVAATGDTAAKRYLQWTNAASRMPLGSDWDGVLTFESK